jgi:uncharacterized membrane protein YdbT with pleckstrin-like domain
MELHGRPHGAALVLPLGRAVVVAAFGAVCVVLGDGVHWAVQVLGAGAITVGALLALAAVCEWERTTIVLAGDTLHVRWGILRRRIAEVRLEHGRPIEIEQGVAGRLLGYGTFVAGELEVPYVPVRSEQACM